MSDESKPPPEDSGETDASRAPEELGWQDSDQQPIQLGAAVDDLERGALVGRFVILARLAKGPFSIVYTAFDPKLDCKIALTLLPVSHEDPAEAKATCARLVRQVMAASKIDHANVVAIHDVGIFTTGVFVAAEYVAGINLRHWMEARDDPFPWHEVLRVFLEAGRGLAAAHAAGVPHGDFKPDNVILGRDGRTCVIDFGLAPAIEDDGEDEAVAALREALPDMLGSFDGGREPSMPSGIRGTPAYMAPEQHAAGRSDAKSDQFAFCVAFYEVLFGERPYKGQRRATLAMEAIGHRVREAPSGADVPDWLRDVLLRGLSPRRKDRFPSLEALLGELDHDPTARRRRWGAGLAGVAAIAAVGGGVAYLLHLERHQCDADPSLLNGVWDASTQAAVHEAFSGSGRPHSAETWAEVRNEVDTWVDEWLDYRVLACRATKEWGAASEELQLRREACLDARLRELSGFTRAYTRVDGPMLDYAVTLASELDPPRTCTREASLEEADHVRSLAVPEANEFAIEATEIRAELASGRPELARVRAEELERRVADAGLPTVAIEATLLRAQAMARLGNIKVANELLHEAAARASAAGLRRPLARVWLALLANSPTETAVSAAWLVHAQTLISELAEPRLRGALAIVEGDRAQAAGRDRAALGSFHHAIEIAEADDIAPRARVTAPLLRLAGLATHRGEWTSANRYLGRALTGQRARLGAQHPQLIATYEAQARISLEREQLDEAVSVLDRALSIATANQPGHETTEARLRVAIGEIELSRGRPQAASSHFDLALATLDGVAEPALRLEALRGKTLGLLALGQNDDAAVAAERALEASQDAVTRSQGMASLIENVATAMWEAPASRPRAIKLVEQARISLAAQGPAAAPGVRQIDAWLEAHASKGPAR